MPALADRSTNVVDMSGYAPVEPQQERPNVGMTPPNLGPGYNVFLRCPLPQVWDSPSDSLRQYYRGFVVPQTRIFTPEPVNNSGGGSTTNITNVSSSSSGGGGGTSTGLVIAQTSVQTPSIGPNTKFIGSFNISKAFQLLNVAVSSPCRVQLYGTATAQSADAFRGLDSPPAAGTVQNIICDVVLDTSPFNWIFQDRVGANNDNPVISTAYITITNLDTINDAITATFSYVPIVV